VYYVKDKYDGTNENARQHHTKVTACTSATQKRNKAKADGDAFVIVSSCIYFCLYAMDHCIRKTGNTVLLTLSIILYRSTTALRPDRFAQ